MLRFARNDANVSAPDLAFGAVLRGGFGERDWFSPAPVIATMVETLSKASGLTYRHTVHSNTPHGYALPDRDVYNKQATYTDWENIFAMFRRQLG